jgi:hypothetical protein
MQPTLQTRGKNQHPPFFSQSGEQFSKIGLRGSMAAWVIVFPMEPRWPIFEKCSHLREKGGVLMLLKTTRHLRAKAQYYIYVTLL